MALVPRARRRRWAHRESRAGARGAPGRGAAGKRIRRLSRRHGTGRARRRCGAGRRVPGVRGGEGVLCERGGGRRTGGDLAGPLGAQDVTLPDRGPPFVGKTGPMQTALILMGLGTAFAAAGVFHGPARWILGVGGLLVAVLAPFAARRSIGLESVSEAGVAGAGVLRPVFI